MPYYLYTDRWHFVRHYAGVGGAATDMPTAGRMSDKVFENMMKAYEERDTTESEEDVPDKSSDIDAQ